MPKTRFFAPVFAAAVAVTLFAAPASAQQPQQQQLQNIQRTQNGDWQVECGDVPGGRGRLCQMTQVVNNPRDNKPIMQAAVIKAPNSNNAVLRLIAPLGIWLRPGLNLSIDGGRANKLDFEFCLREGCVAQLPLSQGLVAAMKRGSAGQVTLQNIRRQKLDLRISLRGFTASYDSL